jgi:hypothetical protein
MSHFLIFAAIDLIGPGPLGDVHSVWSRQRGDVASDGSRLVARQQLGINALGSNRIMRVPDRRGRGERRTLCQQTIVSGSSADLIARLLRAPLDVSI